MKYFLALTIIFSCSFANAQYNPLKGLDLESGEYTLLGTFSESDENALADSLGEWYIDDVQLLKELQTIWTFTKEAPYYACGYHYDISVCKNGKQVSGFSVNLNCKTLVHDGKSYQFDNSLLRYLVGKNIRRFRRESLTMGITEARLYIDSIKNDPRLIYTPEEDWLNYEGTFEFTYDYPKGTEMYFPSLEEKIDKKKLKYSEDSVIVQIEKEIRKKYPDEDFILTTYGGSLTEIFVRLISHKSLEEKFTLYRRDEKYNAWAPFVPRFEVYRKQ